MRLATHNSWSYYKPIPLWQRPIAFIGRCQRRCILSQLDAGVTCFDLRLWWNVKKQEYEIRHGIFVYERGDDMIFFYLMFINSYAETHDKKIYIRVLLEQNRLSKHQEEIEQRFCSFCKTMVEQYPNLIFFYGLRKYDNKIVYPFKDTIDLPIVELYSSVTSPAGPQSHKWYACIDDLFPRLYAWLHNKKHLEYYKDKPVTLMLDFI